ncbi:molybdopterin molybdotransferase MoeA [Paraliomyxa miuraensis]|uniref:molybdopterin molybdotransferase MoeA n=1 Tax=Paraliomyxa miuraensis TaxID=376150 RepID=UPI0022575321|nr:gephyrin-like molybdotransferase Glp [Paraliomyxa miuraensis]MCX4243180.1 molybdopterin molybdotransferase MoeA [Paraliomyxa miuraensis]
MPISVEEAQRLVLEHAAALPAEDVPVAEIDGRIAAAPLQARWDLPQRDVSIMDGYAVRSLDVATLRACSSALVLTVRGESAAGHPSDAPLGEGHAARISTGAVLPAGSDAVIAQEDTRREGDRLVIDGDSLGTLEPGTFVRPAGSELREGDVVARVGRRFGPGDIALLAGSGHATVPVHRRPTVAILSTGDELVPVGQRPDPGQVVSSNGLVLAAMVRRAGAIPIDLGQVDDEPERLRAALARGLEHDVLVTSGGISVGDHDLVHAALMALGARVVFRGVALRPGKPTTFAVTDGARAFGLPGNPASSLVAFVLFVHPLLRRLLGVRGDPRSATMRVRLHAPARGAGNRAHYVRARLIDTQPLDGGTEGPLAQPLSVQQSGDPCSIAGADLLLALPPGAGTLPAGSQVDALVLDPSSAEQPEP